MLPIYLLPFFASPLRLCVSAGAGMLSGEDRVGCLRPSHCIDSRESLRSHAFDYLTALSFLSCLLFSPPLLQQLQIKHTVTEAEIQKLKNKVRD